MDQCCPDIIREICQYLDTIDFIHCILSSKRIYNICLSIYDQKKSLYMRQKKDLDSLEKLRKDIFVDYSGYKICLLMDQYPISFYKLYKNPYNGYIYSLGEFDQVKLLSKYITIYLIEEQLFDKCSTIPTFTLPSILPRGVGLNSYYIEDPTVKEQNNIIKEIIQSGRTVTSNYTIDIHPSTWQYFNQT